MPSTFGKGHSTFYRVLWLRFGWMTLYVILLHWEWNVGLLSLVIGFIIGIWSLIPCRMTDFSLCFHFLASTCLPWSSSGLGVKRTARLYHSGMLESLRLFTTKCFIKAEGKCALTFGSVLDRHWDTVMCRQKVFFFSFSSELEWGLHCIEEEGSLGVAVLPGRNRKVLQDHRHTRTHTHTLVYIERCKSFGIRYMLNTEFLATFSSHV